MSVIGTKYLTIVMENISIVWGINNQQKEVLILVKKMDNGATLVLLCYNINKGRIVILIISLANEIILKSGLNKI